MGCLAAGIRDGFHQVEDFVEISPGQGGGIGEAGEQGRSHHIHPLVRTLGRQYHRHQKLESGPEIEFAFRYGYIGLEPAQYRFVSLLKRQTAP